MTTVTTVRSADGTELVVEQVTHGRRPLATFSGALSVRGSWAAAAEGLADRFAVRLVDRRGKGDSPDTPPYSFEREYDDVAAVAAALGPDTVLAANSSGAICVLGAVTRGLAVSALVLYEPPWPLPGGSDPRLTLDRMDAQLAAADPEGALVTGLRELVGTPDPVITGMRATPEWAGLVRNAVSWPREVREIGALDADLARFGAVDVPVLLLLGTESAGHLRAATEALAAVLPEARVIELEGQGHGALQTAPELVTAAIRDYL